MPIGDDVIGGGPIAGDPGSTPPLCGYFDYLHWVMGWGSCVAPPVPIHHELHGRLIVGPRLSGTFEAGARLSGQVTIGPRLSGRIADEP